MSDAQLDIDFRFNTPEAKRQTEEVRQGAKAVNEEAKAGNKPLAEREGLLERLRRKQDELRESASKAQSVMSVAAINRELQQYEGEIVRVTRAGRAGFDDYGRAIFSHEGILQRLQRMAALYQKGMLEATRTDNIEKYRQKLETVNAEMAKMTKNTMGGGSQWNGLQNSINQLSRELPAFTYSVQTGFMAMSNNFPIFIDEINRLRAANAALNAEGKKGVSVWKQVLSSALSWQTAMMLGITLLTVYGKEIGDFFVRLFEGKKSIDAVKESAKLLAAQMGEAGQAVGKATLEVEDMKRKFKQTRDGIISKEQVLKSYNTGLGKVLGATNDLNVAEERTIKNGNAYIELMFKKAKAAALMKLYTEQMGKAAEEMAKSDEESVSYIMSGTKGKGLRNADGEDVYEANAARNRKEAAAPFVARSERFKKLYLESNDDIESFVKKNGLKLDDSIDPNAASKEENLYKRILRGRKETLDKIRDLDNEYRVLSFSDDDKELEALKQKFADFRKVLDEENGKITEYNKSHSAKIDLLDISAVDPIERRAVSDLTYRQSTEKILKQLDEQSELYSQYEEFKTQTSAQEADKRFSGELAKAKTFVSDLSGQIAALQGKEMTEGLSGVETERLLKLLELQKKLQDHRAQQNNEEYIEAIKLAETIGQAELKIRKKYQDAMAALGEDATEEQRKQLMQGYQEDLQKLIEGSSEYKSVMNVIDTSSRVMLTKAFKTGKETVLSLIDGLKTASDKEKANLKKLFGQWFDQGINKATTGNYDLVAQMTDGFAGLVESSFQFNENLDGGLGTISSMVKTAGQLASTLGDAMGEMGKGLSSAGSFAAIAGAMLSVASALSTGLNQARAARNAEAQEKIDYQNERQLQVTQAMTEALERQLELMNEIYGADRLAKYAESLDSIRQNWTDINSQLGGRFMMTHDSFVNSILTRVNNGESAKQIRKSFSVASKEYYWAEDILDNLDKFQKLNSLPNDIEAAREELAKLQYQAALGNVDDYSQKLIDQLQAQIDLYDETMNRLREENTGNTFSSILNDVKQLFLNSGENAGEAWAQGFDKIMQNYMLQKFSRDWLEEQLQGWYNLMDTYAADGITSNERDLLKEQWDDIKEEGQKRVDAMKDVLGIDDSANNSSSSLSSSGIERITEQTGTEVVGGIRSLYDISKLSLSTIQQLLARANGSHDVFVQQLKHQAAIEANTFGTWDELKKAVIELKAINTNTKGGKYGG